MFMNFTSGREVYGMGPRSIEEHRATLGGSQCDKACANAIKIRGRTGNLAGREAQFRLSSFACQQRRHRHPHRNHDLQALPHRYVWANNIFAAHKKDVANIPASTRGRSSEQVLAACHEVGRKYLYRYLVREHCQGVSLAAIVHMVCRDIDAK